MREIGAMNRLMNAHFDFKYVPKSVLNPVAFSLIWYLLVILGLGIVVALIVCLIEKSLWIRKMHATSRD